ncbi:hypothetical protein, partial [Chelativorans petroleitrophicus]|uniref:hypothetical protein n=1 Tax=Chelativorans petroleitrophicus TaxID=2975484 RepID=UPI0021C06879
MIRFECRKPNCAARIEVALSLIEHEWQKVVEGQCARLFIAIGEATIDDVPRGGVAYAIAVPSGLCRISLPQR